MRKTKPTLLKKKVVLSLLTVGFMAMPLFAQQTVSNIESRRTITNQLGMEFVRIDPGSMLVGRVQINCPEPPDTRGVLTEERWASKDFERCEKLAVRYSRPGFWVTIEQPYYIGKYEVTQAQWEQVMGSNPSFFKDERVDGAAARHPVENVSWKDTQKFIGKLNEMDDEASYRLLTEFEWEYAARAGRDQVLSWEKTRQHAWIMDMDKGTTHPVGQKKPNPWGLHDMLGNVREWVQDYYNNKLYPDPTPPDTGEVHVLRGGAFMDYAVNATFFKHSGGPGNGYDVGFRIVREIE